MLESLIRNLISPISINPDSLLAFLLFNKLSEHRKIIYDAFVKELGAHHVLAIGNGRNDMKMLEIAEIGIAVISPEALCVETLNAADIVTHDIVSAFDLLLKPLRLVATLRS